MGVQTKKTVRYAIVFAGLGLLLLLSVFWNVNAGSVSVPLKQICEIILHGDTADATAYGIIWKIRLPRIMLSVLLGGALSLSGFLIQTFFRNPIAGPFVLGISSGAKMFLAIVTVAMAGVIALVLGVGRRRR